VRSQLTDAMVKRQAPPSTGRLEIFDTIVPALALRVTAAGARSYVVRGRVKGELTPIRLTLGDAQVMKLTDARQAASDALRAMRAGNDPRVLKRAKADAAAGERRNTFAVVAEAFIAEHVSKLRSHRHVAAEIRRYLIKPFGDRPITSITEDDVAEVIRDIAEAGKGAQARLVLAYAKRLFRWAAAPARPRSERLMGNPTLALSARKDFDLTPSQRQTALSPDHLRLIWQGASKLGAPFGPFVWMLMLTGQRRTEVAGMRWSELDFEGDRVWIIPAARMKAKRSHEVPLTPGMIALLAKMGEQRGTGEYVFSTTLGERPISGFSKVKARLDKIIANMNGAALSPWVIHDIRRAARTGLGAIPSVPHDIRELVIAHVPPTLVQTYDLHAYRAEKRQALTLWNDRLMAIVEPPPVEEKVVSLRAAQ
jgi:integrase